MSTSGVAHGVSSFARLTIQNMLAESRIECVLEERGLGDADEALTAESREREKAIESVLDLSVVDRPSVVRNGNPDFA